MMTAVRSDEDGNTMTMCGESANIAVERRMKLKTLSWDEMMRIFAQRPRYLRSGSLATILLCCAYQLVLTKMNDWTRQDCCKEAWNDSNSLGLVQATFFKTAANCNMVFEV